MRYLLDTDICIYIANEKPESVRQRMEQTSPGDLAISSITLAELHFGAEKSAKPEQNRKWMERFVGQIGVIDFAPRDARMYGTMRTTLERHGDIIGGKDLLIASQALERNLVS